MREKGFYLYCERVVRGKRNFLISEINDSMKLKDSLKKNQDEKLRESF